MANFSTEYLRNIVERFNKLENLGSQWDFVKSEIEKEQVYLITNWMDGNLSSDIAQARLHAFRWLLEFIKKAVQQYPLAKKELERTA